MKRDFPEKKDLVYWLLILLIFISVVVAWRTRDPSLLINQISLGSTFLSILLAVVAIFFSIVQSNQSSRESNKTLKELNNLTTQIVSLNSIKDDLSKVVNEYQNAIISFNSKSEAVKGEEGVPISEKMEKINKEFNKKIDSINQKYKTNKFLVRYRLKDEEYDFSEVIMEMEIRGLIRKSYSINKVEEDLFEAEIVTTSLFQIEHNQILTQLQIHLDHPRAEILSVFHIG
jgi:Na+-transporting NADH:ubiquinone oxidoreductase subunit NqrC